MKMFSLIIFCLLIFNNIGNAQAEVSSDDGYLAFAQVMPEPVEGLAAVIKKIQYPAIAKQAGLEGKVFVMAYVDEKGNVDDVKVLKGVGGGCEEEVIKVLKNTKFKPGMNNGQPVKVKTSLSFAFKLK
ncbi:MAG: energy transducer TonB [Ignavibacterium sp.]|jgi:protein TonB|uniref:Energy transducer TonB n=1 Tax=Ignavibacterium album TaxID=591197 RepID=A0A7V3E652_9BACT|nr:energy transducer TonB [Ignavibacterium album]MCA2005195.1 energy transducer TonB [Ignavibacterium sp.]MCX8106933.1 energy transducer TonB [Ignavibacterium album]